MEMEHAVVDSDEADTLVQLATLSDKAHVQRSSASSIVSIRSLGSGSYATVDLVSMPVGADRKLLVRKMLASDRPSVDVTIITRQDVDTKQALVPSLKPSSQQDWHREAAMHRECAHCPFVLQLLAAKRCRSGNLLLLLEYAAQGSLTDILAARRAQLQQSAADRHSAQPAQDTGVAATSPQSFTAVQSQKQAGSSEPVPAEKAATAIVESDTEVVVVLPLAVTAAHIVEEDELAIEEMPSPSSNAALEQSQLPLVVSNEPVLVTLLEDASPAAAMHKDHLGSVVDGCAGLSTASAAGAGAAIGAAAVSRLHPVTHGLSEGSARFYAACLLMALHTLHSRRILHRDIKPCNLLLFHDGYLKLADLGCCCQLPEGVPGARTRTGTAAYMAPEVLMGTEAYSYPVDMWSFGVVIWQMVAGSVPDWAQQQQQPGFHYAPAKLDFPGHFTQELCDLLDGLLHPNSLVRLDIAAVKGSAWFEGFDWQALQDKTMEPPALELV